MMGAREIGERFLSVALHGDDKHRAWLRETVENSLVPDIERALRVRAELLDALKRLVADYGDVPDPTDADGQAVFAQARAAISKAEDAGT